MSRPSQMKNDEIPVLGILRDVSRRGPGPREGAPAVAPYQRRPQRGVGGVFRYLITVEVQGQLHTYVHECGSKDRIDPASFRRPGVLTGLSEEGWVWLWVTPTAHRDHPPCMGGCCFIAVPPHAWRALVPKEAPR